MKKTFLLVLSLSIFAFAKVSAQSAKSFNPEEKFPVDSIKAWTKNLMSELSKSHPGYNRYTTTKRFDFMIDSTLLTVKEPLTTIQYYRKLKPIIAQIGCLHTAINLSDQFEDYIDTIYTLFPFEVYINDGNRAFITKNHSTNKDIPVKSEILSINNKPISEVLPLMKRSMPSDGYNQTLKTLMLSHRFSFWYQSIIELNKHYTVAIKTGDKIETYKIEGVKSTVFPTMSSLEKAHTAQLNFEIKDTVGYLTIHTFAKTDIRRNGQKFKKFIKKTFNTLADNNIKNLVIDLRYNTGGTDGNAAFLASHFFDAPFRYWDKIEVTKDIAAQITGTHRVFYNKPVKVDSTYHWIGARSWLTKEFDYYKAQKPAKNNYKGNTYIITNGLCMSSCSDFVAIISDNKKADIVGQESGGGFQGNTSGMMPTSSFAKNMTITIPLQKYTNAVDLKKNKGSGTTPDYVIKPTLDDWIEKKDVEVLFIKSLIKDKTAKK